jgi:hypothetical protein
MRFSSGKRDGSDSLTGRTLHLRRYDGLLGTHNLARVAFLLRGLGMIMKGVACRTSPVEDFGRDLQLQTTGGARVVCRNRLQLGNLLASVGLWRVGRESRERERAYIYVSNRQLKKKIKKFIDNYSDQWDVPWQRWQPLQWSS